MPTPEFAAHSAETGTSLFSVASPASEQPGSAQSVCPSLSSSTPFSQARLPPAEEASAWAWRPHPAG